MLKSYVIYKLAYVKNGELLGYSDNYFYEELDFLRKKKEREIENSKNNDIDILIIEERITRSVIK